MIAACTIVSPNYLPYARTLAASYLHHHPDHRFFVLIVADIHDKHIFVDEQFTAVFLDELGLDHLRSLAMKYDILELNTNVKPTFLRFLLRTYPSIDTIAYLDPDIYVYDKLQPIFTLLESAAIVLTPHITIPSLEQPLLDVEQSIQLAGTYNLGFIALRRSEEADRMLCWWELRCLQLAYNEARAGLFVDQKWITLVPGLFDNVAICRHPGCNMAHWNLQERYLQLCDDGYHVNKIYKLYFYHFSGIDIGDPDVLSKYTGRFTLQSRPDLRELATTYKTKVTANERPLADSTPYGFDHFRNGVRVTSIARRIFGVHETIFSQDDPFDPTGTFYAFAKKRHLIGGKAYTGQTAWRLVDQGDFRIRIVNQALRGVLRILGPSRYELLMKYLSHISIFRSQGAFIK